MSSRFHIGELSRRSGVTTAALRAWEIRYGLFEPERSPGGTRLYTSRDLSTIRAMQAHMAEGLPAGQAALRVLAQAGGDRASPHTPPATDRHPDQSEAVWTGPPPTSRTTRPGEVGVSELDSAREALSSALVALDRDRAEIVIDRLLAWLPVEMFIVSVVLPYLTDVGRRWARGEAGIAEEHLASNVLRARLLGLTRSRLMENSSPVVVLACPPEERHDLPLVLLMTLLSHRGCRSLLLGADTPIDSVAEAASTVNAKVIVLSSTRPDCFHPVLSHMRQLAVRWPVMIAGPGATREIAAASGTSYLGDLLLGAQAVHDEAQRV